MSLTQESERELVARWQGGDADAGLELVQAYERILFGGVSRYVRSTPTSAEDLMQIVRTELLEAFRKSDPRGAYRPSTYAIKCALGASINQCACDSNIAVKYSARRRARDHEKAGKELPDYLKLLIGLRDTSSLDEPIPASDDAPASTLLDLLPGDLPLPDERLDHEDAIASRRSAIDLAMSKLSERERQAVSRYLMVEEDPSLQEVAAEMGISFQAVHQNIVKAVPKLREAIALALGLDVPRTLAEVSAKKTRPFRPTGDSQSGVILRTLRRVGSASVKDLITATRGSVPEPTLYKVLNRMIDAGFVVSGIGRNSADRRVLLYSLTDAGRAEVERIGSTTPERTEAA